MGLRTALLIAAKDLRQRVRDRSVLLMAVAAPLGLAIIFSQLIGSSVRFHPRYLVVDMDGGPLATMLTDEVIGGLERAGVAEVDSAPGAEAARASVERGEASAAFVIPAGFSAAVNAAQPTRVEVVGGRDQTLATEIARALVTRFGDDVAGVQLAVSTIGGLAGRPLTPEEIGAIVGSASAAPPPIRLVDEAAALRQLSLPTYFAASMAIMFLFFATQVGAISLFEERRQGTLGRMLAGPVGPSTILLGKTIGSFVTGIVAVTVLVLATTQLIGADWGPPLGVALLAVAAVLAAIGVSTLVITFTRTQDGASSASSAVAVTLAVLGGSFSPTSQAPDIMSSLALLTPHGWFMRGLADMHGAGSVVGDSLPAVGVLLAIGIVTGVLGFLRAPRLVAAR